MKFGLLACLASLGALVTVVGVGCSTSGSDNASGGDQDLTAAKCERIGGECRSSPNDALFPANCGDDFGRRELRGSCAQLNQTCCQKPATPDPAPACEAAGGECLSSPNDPAFPASCLDDFSRPLVRGTCSTPNTACCEKQRLPPEPCESVGGECRSSPNDSAHAANCGDDFGTAQLSGICGADNQTCCAKAPAAPGSCEAAGGECMSSPNDPTIAAHCLDDFGRDSLEGSCATTRKACCARPPSR